MTIDIIEGLCGNENIVVLYKTGNYFFERGTILE